MTLAIATSIRRRVKGVKKTLKGPGSVYPAVSRLKEPKDAQKEAHKRGQELILEEQTDGALIDGS